MNKNYHGRDFAILIKDEIDFYNIINIFYYNIKNLLPQFIKV